ncbi:MAG: LCP family protein [Chloroflexi bacterium]|nr:LCP family protein [Chloroflexota bacterium]
MTKPGIAAALSALLPGLGQARLGLRRRGALIALPFVGIIVLGLVAVALDLKGAIETLINPGVLVGVLLLIVAMGAYHLGAIVDAFRLGRRLAPGQPPVGRRAFGSPLLIASLAAVVALYGVIELLGVQAYRATTAIFVSPSSEFQIPAPSFAPRPTPTPGALPSGPMTAPPPPTPTPEPVPQWAQDGRLNLLLVGSDAGPGRWLARMDSINVLSVDIASGRIAIFSLWRYTGNVPLPPESAGAFKNGRFPGWLNALYVYAMGHPDQFPGGEARGFRATAGAVQELIGQPLDGAIVVNLNGFVDLVDAIGGLWIDIPFAVRDDRYALPDGRGYIVVNFAAGCQKLNGERALEYARTRHQDSDYGRMRRQQRVLVALGRQVDPIGLLPQVPKLLDIARDNLWTTLQPGDIAGLAQLAARADKNDIQYYLFWPPQTPQRLDTAGIQHVRDVVGTIFDAPTPTSGPTPEPTPPQKPCPRP